MNAHTFAVTILAALLAVLTLASSAWAECAWVLWNQQVIGPEQTAPHQLRDARDLSTNPWVLVDAVPSRVACKDKMADIIKRVVAPQGFQVSRTKNSWAQRRTDGSGEGIVAFRYLCLPDTVDPRGPKGAPR